MNYMRKYKPDRDFKGMERRKIPKHLCEGVAKGSRLKEMPSDCHYEDVRSVPPASRTVHQQGTPLKKKSIYIYTEDTPK